MELIKINKEHYIICDDSEIKEGDWYVHAQKGVGLRVQKCIGTNLPMDSKKVTHSTQPDKGMENITFISPREVKELIGEVDVEKLFLKIQDDFIDEYDDIFHYYSFVKGYTQALEDNKEKKYTEEDMLRLLYWADSDARNIQGEKFEQFIQSLQPKTSWQVEFIDGKLKLNQPYGTTKSR